MTALKDVYYARCNPEGKGQTSILKRKEKAEFFSQEQLEAHLNLKPSKEFQVNDSEFGALSAAGYVAEEQYKAELRQRIGPNITVAVAVSTADLVQNLARCSAYLREHGSPAKFGQHRYAQGDRVEVLREPHTGDEVPFEWHAGMVIEWLECGGYDVMCDDRVRAECVREHAVRVKPPVSRMCSIM